MRIILLLLSLSLSLPVSAESSKKLRWGADTESGVPYVFRDPKNLERLTGFEWDFVNALAAEMGMEPELITNQWDGLVAGLQAKNYELVVNGLEITEERRREIDFSVPYYVTYEQLVVRKNTYDINSLKDAHGRKVGTLDGALAQRILEEEGKIEVKAYDDETTAYEDLLNERIDAVLLDDPIVQYYAKPNPKLKLVGAPISRLEYGIGIRKSDRELLGRVNDAINRLVQSGKLRKILETWSLWNPMVAQQWNQSAAPQTPASEYDNYMRAIGLERTWKEKAQQYMSYLPMLGKGAVMTLEISILAMILAIVFGLLVSLSRLYGPAPLSMLSLAYVEVWRGTPLLIQLYLIFYGLPHIGLKLSPFIAAIIGLGLNYAACEAENYRAGILSIPKAQVDAAMALGMSRWQALRHVVIPQAVRLVIPPVTNDFIALLKDSSLVSVITLVELTTVYGQLASTYFDYLGIGLLAALVYFLIGLPFVRLSRWVEKFFAFDRSRRAKALLEPIDGTTLKNLPA